MDVYRQMVPPIRLLAFPPSTSSCNPFRVSSQTPHSLLQTPTFFLYMVVLLCCLFTSILSGRMFGRLIVQALSLINPHLSHYVLPFSPSTNLSQSTSIYVFYVLTILFILFIAALHVYSVLKLHYFNVPFSLILLLIYPLCNSPIYLPPYYSVFLHS